MTGPRRTLLSIVAVIAILLSAGGIAYMSSISYPDELGIIDARFRKHQERAVQIANKLRAQIEQNLEYQASLSLVQLAAYREQPVFAMNEDDDIVFPLAQPFRADQEAVQQEGVVPAKGFQSRQRALNRARSLEHSVCNVAKDGCARNAWDYRSATAIYEGLTGYSDTGAEALLGLARIHRRVSEAGLAGRRYLQLAEQFGDRVNESDIPYRLLADIGLSEVNTSPTASFALLRKLVGRQYQAPNALLEVAAYAALKNLKSMPLGSAEQGQAESIEKTFGLAQRDSAFASRIETRRMELRASAGPTVRSLVAPWNAEHNIVYRLLPDNSIRGNILSEKFLQKMASDAAVALGLHQGLLVRVEAMQEGANRSNARRARVSLGPLLPHLALLLWDQEKSGDGFEDIAEARRRHRAITGGLVIVLVLGLWVTIRGAARERELARLKSDFVSTVSHELKTPLTSIRMFALMLQERVAGDDRERESRYHGIIVKESERLGLLIANLLDYSQIERGTYQYSDRNSRAADIVRNACKTFRRMSDDDQQQEVKLEIGENADEALVRVDQEIIVQCLINLLSNAAKYGEGKAISVQARLSPKPNIFEMTVSDLGPGIPSSEHAKIFREFYRSPEAIRSAIQGTGLGLALVKRHVEAQGGHVLVSSIAGKGATFTIELPMVEV
ncbi:MAG: HAMP domain-containing histidine kinase [Kofleriaceae bacterium]|nr:HAMP domain-containing histidine kinase [Kofleriaceae bacterium]